MTYEPVLKNGANMRIFYGFVLLLSVTMLLLIGSSCGSVSYAAGTATLPVQGQTWIAFSSNRDGNFAIYVMSSDGGNVHRISGIDNNDGPVWSPDGKKIAFTAYRNAHKQIYVMNADGTDQTNISHNDFIEGAPTWSPDGRRIAFASVPDEYSASQIYIMDTDGSNRVKISGDHPRDMSEPAWSPDGKRIAFFSHDGGPAIYLMNVDGTNVVKLLEDNWGPLWSPDGRFLASTGTFPNGNCTIYITDLTTRQSTYLLDDTVDGSGPSWSPDGKRIAFSSGRDRPNGSQIYVMNVDGSQQINISKNRFYDEGPSWSPIPISISTFPIELTSLPTLTATPTPLPTIPNSSQTQATYSPMEQTLNAFSTSVINTVTAQAAGTKPPQTPHTKPEIQASQTALKATLFAQATIILATVTAAAK